MKALTLTCLFLLFSLSFAKATFFNIPNFSELKCDVFLNVDPINKLTLEDGIFAIISIIVGIVSVFFGYRLFRVTLLVCGIYVVYIILYPLLTKFGLDDEIANFSISLAVGLMAGLLLMFFYNVGLFIIGCLAGFTFANYLLSLLHETIVSHQPWNYVFIGAFVITFGILILFFKKIILVVSSSTFGSYFVFYGIDVLLNGKTGFAATFKSIISGQHIPRNLSRLTWIMLGASGVLLVIGIIVQFKLTGKGDRFKSPQKAKSHKTVDADHIHELNLVVLNRNSQ